MSQPQDRQVGDKASRGIEERGVHDPAHGDVQLRDRERLHPGERARPGHLEDGECGQVQDRATPAAAAGPGTTKKANAARGTIAQVSRIARCSALTTGDHQRESHSAVRPSTWYFSSSPAFDSYQNGRSQPAVS